jgi:glycosyltransferase involved in cell wall biosynthesis
LASRLLFVLNESYFFMTHRLALAHGAVKAGFEVHVAAPDDHVWAPDGFSIAEIEAEGFQFHAIPLSRRGLNPFADLRTFLALFVLYFRLKPDLVHLLTIKPVVWGGIAARLAGVPAVVCSVTGLGQVFTGRGVGLRIIRGLVTFLYRLATNHKNMRVIVQNKGDSKVLEEAGAVEPGLLRLIRGSGVSLSEFVFSPLPSGDILAVLPARLIWDKGIGEFVEAARNVRKSLPEARFVLVGDTKPSNPRAVPAKTIRGWEEEGIIEWWGRSTDMPSVYAQARVVCFPSTYGEGVPKVLLEAAATGRPVIACDIPGCREFIVDGENGFLVSPGDGSALESALLDLMTDDAKAISMGERGRKIVAEGFSVERVVADTLSVYGELTKGQHNSV